MDKTLAKNYARDGLLWLARNKKYLEAFLLSSGTNILDLRIRSNDTEFLAFVLDFFMTSDELILNFCSDFNINPEDIEKARSTLSEQDIQYWT